MMGTGLWTPQSLTGRLLQPKGRAYFLGTLPKAPPGILSITSVSTWLLEEL